MAATPMSDDAIRLEIASIVENAKSIDDIPIKRQLYGRLELLRMDFLDQPDVADFHKTVHHHEQIIAANKSAAKDKKKHNPKQQQQQKQSPPPAEAASTTEQKSHAGAVTASAPDAAGAAAAEEAIAKLYETDIGKRVQGIMKQFDAARDVLRIDVKAKLSPGHFIRAFAAFIFVLIMTVIMFAALPLYYVQPFLLKRGFSSNYLPLNLLLQLAARGCCLIFGIQLRTEGLNEVNDSRIYIGLFNHVSNFDPVVIEACSPVRFKWLGKKQIFKIPIIGFVLRAYGNIPVDRENREKAIEAINEAVKLIHDSKCSVAISPEGTRSTTGQVLDFKKGAFHMIKQTQMPIIPIIVLGPYELWPPKQLFPRKGVVTVRFLPAIHCKPTDDYNTIANQTRRILLKGVAAPVDPHAEIYRDYTSYSTPFVVFLYSVAYFFVRRFVY